MKASKLIAILTLALVVGLMVVYSVLWFKYAADAKSAVLAAEAQSQKKDAKRAIKLQVGDVKVSGFPLQFNIRVDGLIAEVNSPEENPDIPMQRMSVELDKPIALSLDVFGKDIRLTIPETFRIHDIRESATASTPILVSMKEPTLTTLTLTKSPAQFFMETGDPQPWNARRMVEHFQSFRIKSADSASTIEGKPNPVSTSGPMDVFLGVEHTGENKAHIVLRYIMDAVSLYKDDLQGNEWLSGLVEPSQVPMVQYMLDFEKVAGATDFKLDMNYRGGIARESIVAEEIQFHLKELSLSNKAYRFNLAGNVQNLPEMLAPSVQLTLSVDNYETFLQHYVALLNLLFQNLHADAAQAKASGEKPLKLFGDIPAQVSPAGVYAVKAVLQAASDISTDGKNLTLVIANNKDTQGPVIGKLQLMEVMQYYQSSVDFYTKALEGGSGEIPAPEFTREPPATLEQQPQ